MYRARRKEQHDCSDVQALIFVQQDRRHRRGQTLSGDGTVWARGPRELVSNHCVSVQLLRGLSEALIVSGYFLWRRLVRGYIIAAL